MSRTARTARTLTRSVAVLAALALGGTLAATTAQAAAPSANAPAATSPKAADAAVGHAVPQAEQRAVNGLDFAAIAKKARPVDVPVRRTKSADTQPTDTRPAGQGEQLTVPGVVADAAAPRLAVSRTSAVDGALWPGAYNANPNKQVGKLYFDIDPSAATDWRHCTGTVVNSPNKSVIVAAGHCVYDIANRRWHTNLWFYPGYENGKSLGAYAVRNMWTTANYYASGRLADDMAIVVVNRDSAGKAIANRLGAHGINFNQPVNKVRTMLGYPVTDTRWPGWTSNGEDLYYCQGTDTYYSSGTYAGQLWIGCRMTGGASGGPWLTDVAANWMGTVNSVNSNKGYADSRGSGWMFGPYFDNQELAVYQAARNA